MQFPGCGILAGLDSLEGQSHVKRRCGCTGEPLVGSAAHCVGPDRTLVSTRVDKILSPLRRRRTIISIGDAVLSAGQSHLLEFSCRQDHRLLAAGTMAFQRRSRGREPTTAVDK